MKFIVSSRKLSIANFGPRKKLQINILRPSTRARKRGQKRVSNKVLFIDRFVRHHLKLLFNILFDDSEEHLCCHQKRMEKRAAKLKLLKFGVQHICEMSRIAFVDN